MPANQPPSRHYWVARGVWSLCQVEAAASLDGLAADLLVDSLVDFEDSADAPFAEAALSLVLEPLSLELDALSEESLESFAPFSDGRLGRP